VDTKTLEPNMLQAREQELLAKESRFCSYGDTVHYAEQPTIFERCEGSYLFDLNGRRYLDLQMWYSAVNLGYGNQKVCAALKRQIDRLPQLACQYLHAEKVEVAPVEAALWLCGKLGLDPGDLGYRKGDGATTAKDTDTGPPPTVPASAYDQLAAPGFEHAQQEVIVPGFERSEVTLLAGTSGTFKSLYLLQLSIAVTFGQAAVVGENRISFTGGAVYYSYEDSPAVVYKRMDAILQRYGLSPASARPFDLHVRTEKLLVKRNGQIAVDPKEMAVLEAIRQTMPDGNLGLVGSDTLSAMLASEESNLDFQQVMDVLYPLANHLGAAVGVTHHFRKGLPGSKSDDEPTLENMRGGSALGNSGRNVLYMLLPTKKQAADFGLGPEEQRNYVRLHHVKTSHGELSKDRWFVKETRDIAVRNRRTGAVGTEKAPVLVGMQIQAQAMAAARAQLVKYRDILEAKEVELAKLGRKIRVMERHQGNPDSVQKILGVGDQRAKEVVDELVKWKVAETPTISAPRSGNLHKTLHIAKPFEDQTLSDDDAEI